MFDYFMLMDHGQKIMTIASAVVGVIGFFVLIWGVSIGFDGELIHARSIFLVGHCAASIGTSMTSALARIPPTRYVG